MNYEQIVSWGRGIDEYQKMFHLSSPAQQGPILAVGEGPASFGAQWRASGGEVLSIDPLYGKTLTEISEQVKNTALQVTEQLENNLDAFHWDAYRDPQALLTARLASLELFEADFSAHRSHYLNAALPCLPLEPGHFQLALCSHLLFLYDQHLDLSFHIQALQELLRLAPEVRVYPVVNLQNQRSTHLEVVCQHFPQARLEPVSYHFQKGACEMLVVTQD